MLKVRFEYDLPEYDPSKHDPDKVFGFLTYRGVHYAKWIDLKSRADKIGRATRLNSSHITISYAVFCLKKKKNNTYTYSLIFH